ncbi:MerR family transcriptional regulator [Acetonema longum]|uniref:Multidrug-efflux transporter 2 regulator n=1 Tax=Acetonema longum DSM 6540 TaxID=1009370 RepID=F7NGU3_9FIRM|nr:MerR family transcriptional regulator [Acetonema longum]EGO64674.1 multidrug-efflux transporter 2 regulator [Acetonema longum DSM 6540]
MNEFLQKQLTTSQFAAMYGINKRTLMYYDSIDLFKPAVVKENGYRYYTLSQMILFDAIQLLRKLRVPLEEIKAQLAKHYTPQNQLAFLYKQNQLLEQEMDELRWLQRVVQNKIGSMEAISTVDPAKIEILEQVAQAIVISQSIFDLPIEKALKVLTNFMRDCYHTRSYTGYPDGYMVDARQLQQRNFNPNSFCQITHCFYPVDAEQAQSMTCAYKPSGRYLVGYHKGNLLQISQALQRLADYADAHKLTFTGHAYIERVLDDIAPAEDPFYSEVRISVLLE